MTKPDRRYCQGCEAYWPIKAYHPDGDRVCRLDIEKTCGWIEKTPVADPLCEIIDHGEACFTLGLLADILDIEIPGEARTVQFFLERIKTTVKTNQKRAKELQLVMDAHKVLHGGR